MFFNDRTDAGQKLAETFRKLNRDFSGYEVAGIAKGGVIVAAPVAEALDLPLKSLVVDDFADKDGKQLFVVTSFSSGLVFNTAGRRVPPKFVPDFSGETAKDFPEDVWSSLRAPSNVPVMTVLEPSNAVLAALQILSARNPRLYAQVRMEIEKRTVNTAPL